MQSREGSSIVNVILLLFFSYFFPLGLFFFVFTPFSTFPSLHSIPTITPRINTIHHKHLIMEMETEAKPQEQSQEQSQEMPLAEPQNAENAIEVESSIPTPSFTPQPETVENSPSSQTADEASSASNSEVAPSEPTTVPSSPSSQSQSQSHKPHDKVAPPPPQIKRRPRRTGQPLHLLLQDCSRQVCF